MAVSRNIWLTPNHVVDLETVWLAIYDNGLEPDGWTRCPAVAGHLVQPFYSRSLPYMANHKISKANHMVQGQLYAAAGGHMIQPHG